MFVSGLHQREIPATLLECLSHAARSFSSIDDLVVQCEVTQQQRPLLQLFPAVIFFFFFFLKFSQRTLLSQLLQHFPANKLYCKLVQVLFNVLVTRLTTDATKLCWSGHARWDFGFSTGNLTSATLAVITEDLFL